MLLLLLKLTNLLWAKEVGEDVGGVMCICITRALFSLPRHFFWNAGIGWIQKVVSDGEVSLQGQALAKHPGFSRLEHV